MLFRSGRTPVAEQQPTAPSDAAKALPRICDALAAYVSNTNSAVFECSQDRLGYFEGEGSSYEWNSLFNGQPLDQLTKLAQGVLMNVSGAEAPMLYDYEWFHLDSGGAHMNVVYADGHVDHWP